MTARAASAVVEIVPMRRRHVSAVMRTDAQVYDHPWTRELYLSELGQTDSRRYVVALAGRRVVGAAGLMMGDDAAHVSTVVVHPEWHGRGVGSALMLHLAEEARGLGLQTLSLEVAADNHAAQALYRRFGFAPAGVRKGYYRSRDGTSATDALVMWVHDVGGAEYAARLDAIRREKEQR